MRSLKGTLQRVYALQVLLLWWFYTTHAFPALLTGIKEDIYPSILSNEKPSENHPTPLLATKWARLTLKFYSFLDDYPYYLRGQVLRNDQFIESQPCLNAASPMEQLNEIEDEDKLIRSRRTGSNSNQKAPIKFRVCGPTGPTGVTGRKSQFVLAKSSETLAKNSTT